MIWHFFILFCAAMAAMTPSFAQTAPVIQNEAPSASITNDEFTAVQNKILSNPQALQEIQVLVADPEIMSALSDPEFMKAVQSRDPAAIQASPRAQELMANPKIKTLIEKLQQLLSD